MASDNDRQRVWSATQGMGWLSGHAATHRFTPDDSSQPVTAFSWRRAGTGKTPGRAPRGKQARAEWDEWIYFVTSTGDTVAFRRGGPPSEADREVQAPASKRSLVARPASKFIEDDGYDEKLGFDEPTEFEVPHSLGERLGERNYAAFLMVNPVEGGGDTDEVEGCLARYEHYLRFLPAPGPARHIADTVTVRVWRLAGSTTYAARISEREQDRLSLHVPAAVHGHSKAAAVKALRKWVEEHRSTTWAETTVVQDGGD